MIRSLRRYGLIVLMVAACVVAPLVPVASRAEGVTVTSPEGLRQELESRTAEIIIGADIPTSGTIVIDYPVQIKFIDESVTWTHAGTMIFTNRDYNYVLDYIDNVNKADFTARYRWSNSIVGATPSETVNVIRYYDGPEDDGTKADAHITESGSLIVNVLGKRNSSWKNIYEVSGVVTNEGTYHFGSQHEDVLFREYRITYITTATGQEVIIQDIDGPVSYTEDDLTITLPQLFLKGFKFLGWSLVDGSTEYVTEIPAGSTGDKTFYANFEEDPQQGGGSHVGWGGHSFSGLSGLFSSAGTSTADTSTSDISDQVQIAVGQPDATNNGRKTATGKSRTDVVFSGSSSGSLDLDGVIKTDTKPNRTRQILILGIGLVAASAIGMIALLKKKR